MMNGIKMKRWIRFGNLYILLMRRYQFCTNHNISFDSRDIFRDFGVSERSGYRIIQQGASSRRHEGIETRGRKRKVTEDQVKKADDILQNEELKLKGKRYT